MTSKDHQQFITVEVFRSEIGDLRTEIRGLGSQISELKSEIQAVRDIAISNSAKIDAHWGATSMWFSFIAVIIAGIGAVAAFIALFKDSTKSNNLTEQKVQSLIDASINDAVAKALGVSGK